MKRQYQSEVIGYLNSIKTKTSRSIKHLRKSVSKSTLNANKIGFMENLFLGYRLSSRCYNYFTCTVVSKKCIAQQG